MCLLVPNSERKTSRGRNAASEKCLRSPHIIGLLLLLSARSRVIESRRRIIMLPRYHVVLIDYDRGKCLCTLLSPARTTTTGNNDSMALIGRGAEADVPRRYNIISFFFRRHYRYYYV